MNEWKAYKLGEVADVQTGPFGSQLHQSDYVAYGIPSIMPVNIGNRLDIITDKIVYVSEEDADRLKKYRVKEGDIVYSRRGDVEKCAYIGTKENGWLCGTGCLRIRIDMTMAHPRFVAYYLSTEEVKSWISNNAVGTTMPNLNSGILQCVDMLLPPIDEQKWIAGVLSSLDDKIDLLNRENATLEALAETLFRHYFIENPNPDWKEGKLGDVCHYVTDKMETSSLTTISYISTENMLNDKQGVTEASSIPNDIRVTRYGGGDILLSNIRPYFKKIWLADRRGGCSNDVLCIRANEKEFDCFVYYTLRQDDFFDYVMLGSKGCKMPRGDKQHIMNWPICLPNVESLGVFNKPVYLMIQKIKSNQQQIQTLTIKRDTLLPRLMSGEVNVVAH